jgi:two-component system sensor histidine kinase PrrB
VRNLRGRLTLGVLTVMVAVLAVGGVVVTHEVDRSERQRIDDTLQRTARLSIPLASAAVQEGLPGVDKSLDAVLRATGSSLRLTLGRQTLAESGSPLPKALRTPLGFSTERIAGRNVRLYTTTLRDRDLGGLARLVVSSSLRQVEVRQRSLRRKMLALGGGMLLVAGLGVFLAASGALRPLRRLRATTASIAVDEDLSQRVPVDGPSELRALAGSFNEMLVRLGRSADERNTALAATRRFAADAGHELRTPLTSVQASLSILARHPELDARQRTELAEDAMTEQLRLVHLLDGLQALARGDANPVEHTDVDLTEVVDASLQAARARHPGVTWTTDLQARDATVRGWEAGLRLLVDNLLENAARHGRPDGEVRVAVSGGPGGLVLRVEDDGPGVPEDERERIFLPFARAALTDRPGSGLGLALVAQQAGHHGATVSVERSEALGGAAFAVRFGRGDAGEAATAPRPAG